MRPPGWVSSHQLNASVVTVKHASKMGHDGLLSPILRRAQAGATDVSVFELKVGTKPIASIAQHSPMSWYNAHQAFI